MKHGRAKNLDISFDTCLDIWADKIPTEGHQCPSVKVAISAKNSAKKNLLKCLK